MIRIYDQSGNVIETHDYAGEFKERLTAAGLSARDLDSLPGSDVRKVALASLILEQTVARQSWIADKLAMRSAANVSQQVRRYRTQRPRLAAKFREYLESASLSRFVD